LGAEKLHDQPVPLPDTYVKVPGIGTVTVMGPDVSGPRFEPLMLQVTFPAPMDGFGAPLMAKLKFAPLLMVVFCVNASLSALVSVLPVCVAVAVVLMSAGVVGVV